MQKLLIAPLIALLCSSCTNIKTEVIKGSKNTTSVRKMSFDWDGKTDVSSSIKVD